MKRIFFFFVLISFMGCGGDAPINSCFQLNSFNDVANLNNAEFVNIQVVGGFAYTTLSGRNLVIYRPTQNQYKVFDRRCPEDSSCGLMTFENLLLKCPCDGKEYNPLNGSPTDGEGCFALEYNAVLIGNNTLQISR